MVFPRWERCRSHTHRKRKEFSAQLKIENPALLILFQHCLPMAVNNTLGLAIIQFFSVRLCFNTYRYLVSKNTEFSNEWLRKMYNYFSLLQRRTLFSKPCLSLYKRRCKNVLFSIVLTTIFVKTCLFIPNITDWAQDKCLIHLQAPAVWSLPIS